MGYTMKDKKDIINYDWWGGYILKFDCSYSEHEIMCFNDFLEYITPKKPQTMLDILLETEKYGI